MEKVKKQKNTEVSAPGKLILTGEHSVVYGYPAIVTAVNQRLTVNDRFQVRSTIPLGCGMGSSAAYEVAMAAMKMKLSGKTIDREKINNLAYEAEKGHHSNPSGVDNTICTYGGYIWYRKESDKLKTFNQITVTKKTPPVFIYNTGKPIESTSEMVLQVAQIYKNNSPRIENIFREIEKITKSLLRYLTNEEQINFGELIKENEKQLELLGVVSSSTMDLINRIEKIGGFAKISGAGGKKDASGIIIIYHPEIDKLKKFSADNQLDILGVNLGEGGLVCE